METSGEASTWISSATSYDHLSNAPDIKFLECTVHFGKTLERISGENDRKSFALEVEKPAWNLAKSETHFQKAS